MDIRIFKKCKRSDIKRPDLKLGKICFWRGKKQAFFCDIIKRARSLNFSLFQFVSGFGKVKASQKIKIIKGLSETCLEKLKAK